MIGKFKIVEFQNSLMVKACSCMNNRIEGLFYLPPLARQNTTNIDVDDIFFGVLDEVSGYGALIVAFDGADFQGRFDYNLHLTESITVDKNLDVGENATINGETTCEDIIKAKDDILFGINQNSIMTHKHTATDVSIPGLTCNPQTFKVTGKTDGGTFL